MRDYAKVVKSLDDNVGRLLDHLKEKGLLDNTLVVYTSDQGFYMGEHGWFDKRFMYEESLNTPLLMHLPKGLKARGDINEMVQNIDYAPTFLELAGAPIPSDIQGVFACATAQRAAPQKLAQECLLSLLRISCGTQRAPSLWCAWRALQIDAFL